jgi:hypothetical protein
MDSYDCMRESRLNRPRMYASFASDSGAAGVAVVEFIVISPAATQGHVTLFRPTGEGAGSGAKR